MPFELTNAEQEKPIVKLQIADFTIFVLDSSMQIRIQHIDSEGKIQKTTELKIEGNEFNNYAAEQPSGITRYDDLKAALYKIIANRYSGRVI